ncbi:MAG: hypothetical protein HYV60_05865, partial [Planctomycetia bacterium]|nr:hypothetical protein [Planctomycetia bacterium]
MAKHSHWSKTRSVMERVGPAAAVVAIVVVGFFGSEWLMHEEAASAEPEHSVSVAVEEVLSETSFV